MNSALLLRIVTVPAILCAPVWLAAQTPASFLQNHLRGRSILEQAVIAMSAPQGIKALQQLEYTATGSLSPELAPKFLDVTGNTLTLGSAGEQKLIVYRIPNTPHVKDMLVLYDPTTRTIMDGDLFASFFPRRLPATGALPPGSSRRRLRTW